MKSRLAGGTSLVAAAIAVVSLVNAGQAVRPFFHTSLFLEDDISRRERVLTTTKLALQRMGVSRITYFDEEKEWKTIEAVGEFFAAQYTLAPVLLERDSPNNLLALVNFRLSKKPAEIPGYALVEDFGGGFVLYRRR